MPEAELDYWREDPLLSDHHEHWHAVYPYRGSPDRAAHTPQEIADIRKGTATAKILSWNARHGELFAYMHEQLLARYAAERLSLGLPPVVGLDDYRAPIADGYDPAVEVLHEGNISRAALRPDAASLSGLRNAQWAARPGADLSNQELYRDRLRVAVLTGRNLPHTLNDFAEMIEPTDRRNSTNFGALHNDGHLLISMFDDNPNERGVLFWEAVAVRDPVFYRWHVHVDELFDHFRRRLRPHNFSALPDVEITNVRTVSDAGDHNELWTIMRRRKIHYLAGRPNVDDIDYLSHEHFIYEIEIANRLSTDADIAIRIFLAPEQGIDDYRSWIEMDKFPATIRARSLSQVSRSSLESSVIRHPGITSDILEDDHLAASALAKSSSCQCGWPYTLLLPRGTETGLDFRLLAIATPGADLAPAARSSATGSSYCGIADSEYPDVRPMGYPFDRPLAAHQPISTWLARPPPQVCSVPLRIYHRDERP